MKEVSLEELSEQYRDDGIWTDEAENIQNSYILENIEDIFQRFMSNRAELDMTFEQFIGLEIGLWQAKNGFYRTTEQLKLNLGEKEMKEYKYTTTEKITITREYFVLGKSQEDSEKMFYTLGEKDGTIVEESGGIEIVDFVEEL